MCPASISPPLPPTLKWICGASQDKKKKMSEWREETEAEERGGQAGRHDGGGGFGWNSAAVPQYGPVAALAKKCRCASVKEDLGFG